VEENATPLIQPNDSVCKTYASMVGVAVNTALAYAPDVIFAVVPLPPRCPDVHRCLIPNRSGMAASKKQAPENVRTNGIN